MTIRDEFESLFSSLARAPVVSAFSDDRGQKSASGSPEEISEEEILSLLQEAQKRLQKDPSLFSGDPEGIFTYDDPILAAGAYFFHAASKYASLIATAGGDGLELRNSAFWHWTKVGIRAFFSHSDSSFIELAGMVPSEAITLDKEVVRLAVVGDAGYQCQAQANVLYAITTRHHTAPFDLIIHLGDVYFAGSKQEMLSNFLVPFKTIGPRVLTLAGNHDLYFGAESFIAALTLLRQPGRFFCIETPGWRVVGLDTSLASRQILRQEGRLDQSQIKWLDGILAKRDPKNVVLMSHHFVRSAWGKVSTVLKRQIKSRLQEDSRVVAWYWGHEHSCAAYGKDKTGHYGACIGNGAFLELWKPPTRQPRPDWYARGRCSCYGDEAKFWPHGYLELEMWPGEIREHFHLENGESHTRVLKVN